MHWIVILHLLTNTNFVSQVDSSTAGVALCLDAEDETANKTNKTKTQGFDDDETTNKTKTQGISGGYKINLSTVLIVVSLSFASFLI